MNYGKETVNLTASAATASGTMTFNIPHISDGAATMFVDCTENSGTATAVTVTAKIKGNNSSAYAYEAATGTATGAETVATIAAADIAAGDSVFVSLSGLSWWTYADAVELTFAAASGTFNVDLAVSIEGT